MLISKKMLMCGVAAAMFASPALAEDRSTETQKEQYIYQNSEQLGSQAADKDGAIGATKPNSGPGVQGPADTRTGPSTKAPGDAAGDASSGASSGEAGMDGDKKNETNPAQDSSGVQGFPDTRTGPATKEPGAAAE
jgi:hypothetical protein